MIVTACSRCGGEVKLKSGSEKPAGYALSIARHIICDRCGEEIDNGEKAAKAESLLKSRLLASGLPEAMRGHDFSEIYEQTPAGEDRRPAIAAARDWAKMGDPGGLCLFGGVGSGKTLLAACAAYERLQHHSLRWVSLARLIAQLGRAFSDDEKRRAIDAITGRGGIVIDDLDKAKASEWVVNQIFAAIDGRIEAGAPLLITTNLKPSEIADKFGAPIASRISGYCRVVEFPGPDYRVEQRRQAA